MKGAFIVLLALAMFWSGIAIGMTASKWQSQNYEVERDLIWSNFDAICDRLDGLEVRHD